MTDHHSSIYRKLNYFLDNGEIPNIIFHGSAGTGKKTIVYNFLDQIYGKIRATKSDNPASPTIVGKLKNNIMSVNCCHGKGIKFIRDEIKTFSRMNIQHAEGVFFKSIVLFNADYLTIDAQSALRRCIEKFSFNTRYFIVVENIHKLLNPIVSRFCVIYVPELLSISVNGETAPTTDPPVFKFINLHRIDIENTIDDLDREHESRKVAIIKEKLNGDEKTPAELIDIVDYFYDNGISAIDVLRVMGKDFEEIKNLQNMKGNFRSEKLLMYTLVAEAGSV